MLTYAQYTKSVTLKQKEGEHSIIILLLYFYCVVFFWFAFLLSVINPDKNQTITRLSLYQIHQQSLYFILDIPTHIQSTYLYICVSFLANKKSSNSKVGGYYIFSVTFDPLRCYESIDPRNVQRQNVQR